VALVWPLVGRVEELRFVDAVMRRRSGAAGVVVAGAAGVGKTRLAREALAAVEQRGMRVGWVAATASSRPLPLGAFAGVLGDLGQDPAQVLRRATETLLTGVGGSGVVLGVDDAHLLDELSATLVQQVVVRRDATVMLTVRSGEPAPDAVTSLWKDNLLERLELQPVSELETEALLEAVLGGPLDRSAAGRLWQMSQGNVLFLRQLVDGAVERGALRDEGGLWRLRETTLVTPGLAELVAVRMGALSEPVRDVVDILAVDEPLDVSLLGVLTDPAAVEQAEEQGIVEVGRDGSRLQARLAHPLFGEVRRTEMGRLRARRLRARIATALAATADRGPEDTLRRAVLMVDSDLEPDPAVFTAAAEQAACLTDLPLARRLGKAAVDAGGGFRAQAVVASATSFIGDAEDADAELSALAQLASTDAELVNATLSRAVFLAWPGVRTADAVRLLAETLPRLVDADDRRPLIALQAMIDGQVGLAGRAEEAALTVLADKDRVDDAELMACCGLVAALASTGRADQMGPYVERGVAAAARSGQFAFFRLPLITLQLTGLRLAGYLDEGARIAAECRETIKDLPLGSEIGCFLTGDAELYRGRLGPALRWLRQARVGVEQFGDRGVWRCAILIDLTRTLAICGDVKAAQEALADLNRYRHPTIAFVDPEMILARAWVTAAEGALHQATTLAHEAATLAASGGHLALETLALQTAVCFGDPSPAGRLAELATLVDGPRAPLAAAHAAGLADDDGDALHDTSRRLEKIGDLLVAADAGAQAAGAYTRAGRHKSAAGAAARAHRLAEACGDAHTPALITAATPLSLTDREREVVILAARGLTNRQIAERLVVSVRTVEGHLYRASAKLGTSNRAEFADLLGIG